MGAQTAILLDQVLDAACDIDHALELAEKLGWNICRVDIDPPWPGKFFVMLRGPIGPCVNLHWHKPEIEQRHRYSNATFRSFYGALMLALLHGLECEKKMDADVLAFERGAHP